ncbi:membrane-associated proteins in eicosanoid and glutathione metabolism [Viridothelium virens]|uniref:Membrane-associated proteins in eicosanoid and glutathione metabolism n=1 Tax=Viridothelium virens TaxID=1048519 RepID=A0A6A6GSZ6_VIRVR|nr:membrane-associated proteins in eicosanoid and glutathione metabolism [Viridothelium virens]
MAMATITVPKDYGYVLLSAALTPLLASWLSFRVPPYRSRAKVAMPQVYAEHSQIAAAEPAQQKAMYLYNCAQRAHGNFVENQPSLLISLLIAGLRWPLVSAGLGAAWSVSRVLYSVGYTDETKERGSGRYVGLWWIPVQSVLFLMAAWVGGEFALQ